MKRFYDYRGDGNERDAELITSQTEASEKTGWRTREQLAREFGISPATIERVKTILEEGAEEQKASLRDNSNEKGPGVRTVYEQIQFAKLQSRLHGQDSTTVPALAVRKDNLKLLNKDFRGVTQEEISDGSVDLVLALNFPEARRREDKGGRIHEQLLECASRWLKDGGLLVMHVERALPPKDNIL